MARPVSYNRSAVSRAYSAIRAPAGPKGHMSMTPSHARGSDPMGTLLRLIAWGTVFIAFAFLFENWLMHWQGQPGARAFARGEGGLFAALSYAVAVALTLWFVFGRGARSLMQDAGSISALTAYLTRSVFWLVILIGVVDSAISFARVEGMLPGLVGDEMAIQFGLSQWRGPYIHMPLAALSFVIGFFTRGATFIWLALWVVASQLLIVVGRFVFSYEQAFLADLVRFWYAAMFLLASAYTLEDDGHVRVDVFYGAMSARGKAMVNGVGAILFGMTMTWIILILGTSSRSSTILGPFVNYEQDQQTFGLMTKYWMAAFLGIFAVTMLFQFCWMLLKAGADWRAAKHPQTAAE